MKIISIFSFLAASIISMPAYSQVQHHGNTNADSFYPWDDQPGWYETSETELLYIDLNLLGAENLDYLAKDVKEVFQNILSFSTHQNISILTQFALNFHALTPATSVVAQIRDLYANNVTPEDDYDALFKGIFVAVLDSALEGNSFPLVNQILNNYSGYIGTEFREFGQDRLSDLNEIINTLASDTLNVGLDSTDFAGKFTLHPGLSDDEGHGRASAVKKYGCKKYGWWPFYIAPPLDKAVTCGGANDTTVVICGNPTSNCRKCTGGGGSVCEGCCDYFEGGPLCKRNCGDSSIANVDP